MTSEDTGTTIHHSYLRWGWLNNYKIFFLRIPTSLTQPFTVKETSLGLQTFEACQLTLIAKGGRKYQSVSMEYDTEIDVLYKNINLSWLRPCGINLSWSGQHQQTIHLWIRDLEKHDIVTIKTIRVRPEINLPVCLFPSGFERSNSQNDANNKTQSE